MFLILKMKDFDPLPKITKEVKLIGQMGSINVPWIMARNSMRSLDNRKNTLVS